MGLISSVMGLLFGGSRNVVRETVELFRENSEAGAQRSHGAQTQAMTQFGEEFSHPTQGAFDRFMDGLNRLPRPALALGTLGLFVSAMVDPLWFAARMQGIALVPEPLWWLLGVIVSFYFGARHQAKMQGLQRDLAASVARAPEVIGNISALRSLRSDDLNAADPGPEASVNLAAVNPEGNPALTHWRALRQA